MVVSEFKSLQVLNFSRGIRSQPRTRARRFELFRTSRSGLRSACGDRSVPTLQVCKQCLGIPLPHDLCLSGTFFDFWVGFQGNQRGHRHVARRIFVFFGPRRPECLGPKDETQKEAQHAFIGGGLFGSVRLVRQNNETPIFCRENMFWRILICAASPFECLAYTGKRVLSFVCFFGLLLG